MMLAAPGDCLRVYIERKISATFWFAGSRVTIFSLEPFFRTVSGRKVFYEVVFLILESLGSTELLFILVMALIFFGPRKLPQLSRTLGKNIAEFKRASEEFKRTWDKEVSLEETDVSATVGASSALPAPNSILDNAPIGRSLQSPSIEPIAPDRVIARHSIESDPLHSAAETGSASEQTDFDGVADEAQPSRKQDWL